MENFSNTKNFLNMEDLKDVLNEMDDIVEEPEELEGEALASQRRYEEIIKKHKPK